MEMNLDELIKQVNQQNIEKFDVVIPDGTWVNSAQQPLPTDQSIHLKYMLMQQFENAVGRDSALSFIANCCHYIDQVFGTNYESNFRPHDFSEFLGNE